MAKFFSVLLVVLGVAYSLAEEDFVRQIFHNRIVGGQEAVKGSHPYIVEIRVGNGHYCGASVINANYILTAAHCSQRNRGDYQVVAGEHNIRQNEGTEQFRRISQIINHPDYNDNNYDNDISIWKVDTPFTLNANVRTTRIPPSGYTPQGSNATVAGWGALKEGGSSPTTLYEVQVPLVTNAECNRRYGNGITENMLCAGIKDKDSCQGDSGGPLMCNGDGGHVQCGVVSWGTGCARENYPGVYARVSRYTQWIASNTGGGGDDTGSTTTTARPNTCAENQWQCANKKCIPCSWICDRDNDCGDNSDEQACGTRDQPKCKCSNADQFRCNNHRCIPCSWVCDGDRDCGDANNSDEEGCPNNRPACPNGV